MEHSLKQVFYGAPVQKPNHADLRYETTDDLKREWERRRDDEIRLAVMTALHWDLAVPRDGIEATVRGGWVTLTGQVRRAYERSCPEADALMTSGVAGVTNDIHCKPAVR